MAFTENPSIGVFVENRFGLKELNNGALAFVLPLKKTGQLVWDYIPSINQSYFQGKN